MSVLIQKAPSEGSPCKNFFCTGHYQYTAPKDSECTCHMRPPCSHCESYYLSCDKCEDTPDA